MSKRKADAQSEADRRELKASLEEKIQEATKKPRKSRILAVHYDLVDRVPNGDFVYLTEAFGSGNYTPDRNSGGIGSGFFCLVAEDEKDFSVFPPPVDEMGRKGIRLDLLDPWKSPFQVHTREKLEALQEASMSFLLYAINRRPDQFYMALPRWSRWMNLEPAYEAKLRQYEQDLEDAKDEESLPEPGDYETKKGDLITLKRVASHKYTISNKLKPGRERLIGFRLLLAESKSWKRLSPAKTQIPFEEKSREQLAKEHDLHIDRHMLKTRREGLIRQLATLGFKDVTEKELDSAVDRMFHYAQDGVTHQPIVHFMLDRGYDGVVNWVENNTRVGSVLFNFRPFVEQLKTLWKKEASEKPAASFLEDDDEVLDPQFESKEAKVRAAQAKHMRDIGDFAGRKAKYHGLKEWTFRELEDLDDPPSDWEEGEGDDSEEQEDS